MVKEPKSMKDLPITPLSSPTIASVGKTGFWRTFRPVIDEKKCTRCLLCWIFCPEGCIIRGPDDAPEIDYDYCKGCGVCANECRLGAITMERENV
jgi:2-oxoacid:acceptor oxidoreductase delta subunit (pyruvate/2-ketoisovalerate family)